MRLAHTGRIDRALNCSASRTGGELRNQSARKCDGIHDIALPRRCHQAVAEVRTTMAAVLLILPANGSLTAEGWGTAEVHGAAANGSHASMSRGPALDM